jgi:predicted RNase H-like HicB family nuclease
MPIYVSRGADGRWAASIPELSGCFATGATREEAVAGVREAARDYVAFLEERDIAPDRPVDAATLAVREPDEPFTFPEDLTPMEEHELKDFLHRFEAFHAELTDAVRGMTQAELEKAPAEGEWSLREVLQHVMTSELLFLSRLEPWPRGEFATVNAVRRLVAQRFSVMEATDTQGEHTILGRRWTAKKVTRRLLEHLFDHLRQVRAAAATLRR